VRLHPSMAVSWQDQRTRCNLDRHQNLGRNAVRANDCEVVHHLSSNGASSGAILPCRPHLGGQPGWTTSTSDVVSVPLFMLCEPLDGWREVSLSGDRAVTHYQDPDSTKRPYSPGNRPGVKDHSCQEVQTSGMGRRHVVLQWR
jgi:hypothetical protein